MIQVTVGTNTNRRRVNVDPNLTIKEVKKLYEYKNWKVW